MISTLFAKVFSPIARWFGFELSINVSDYYLDPTPNGDYINLSDHYLDLSQNGGNNDHNHGGGSDVGTKHYH